MKIVITGATGSLGAALTKHFHKAGHEIIATGRTSNPPQALLNVAEYLEADITKPFQLPEADVCIHAAALSDDKASLKDLMLANKTGTINTINAARNCKLFIHISSSSVYLPSSELLKEEVAGNQNNKQLSPYGYSKLQAEYALHDEFKGNSCYVVRPRALYGPCDKMILPRLLKLIKDGTVKHPGTMKNKVSLTHYDNLNNAIELIIQKQETGIHTYNIADNETYVFMDVVRKLTSALYGKTLPEKQIPIIIPKIMSVFKINGITPLLVRSFTKDMVLDISKIQKELNYSPKTNLDSSLKELKLWVDSIGGIPVLSTGTRDLAWK